MDANVATIATMPTTIGNVMLKGRCKMQCKICGKPTIGNNICCSDSCRKTYKRIYNNQHREITTARRLPITKVTCTTCGQEYYIRMNEYKRYIENCIESGEELPRHCPQCGRKPYLDHNAKSFSVVEVNLDVDLYYVKRIKKPVFDLYVPPQVFDYDDRPAPVVKIMLLAPQRNLYTYGEKAKKELRLAWF